MLVQTTHQWRTRGLSQEENLAKSGPLTTEAKSGKSGPLTTENI